MQGLPEGFQKDAAEAAVITLENGKTYFVDNRLKELRNVYNPYDCEDFPELLQDA